MQNDFAVLYLKFSMNCIVLEYAEKLTVLAHPYSLLGRAKTTLDGVDTCA